MREYDIKLGTDDYLNRCTISNVGFHSESFKLGSHTLGEENDSTGLKFIFYNQLRQFANPALSQPPQSTTAIKAVILKIGHLVHPVMILQYTGHFNQMLW